MASERGVILITVVLNLLQLRLPRERRMAGRLPADTDSAFLELPRELVVVCESKVFTSNFLRLCRTAWGSVCVTEFVLQWSIPVESCRSRSVFPISVIPGSVRLMTASTWRCLGLRCLVRFQPLLVSTTQNHDRKQFFYVLSELLGLGTRASRRHVTGPDRLHCV